MTTDITSFVLDLKQNTLKMAYREDDSSGIVPENTARLRRTNELDHVAHREDLRNETTAENAPLIKNLSRQFSLNWTEDVVIQRRERSIGTFAGVFVPVALSMFSTILFLRLGLVVGQAGLLEAIVQFMLAYLILIMTVLSICAISTNGAVEGGGAYYMISRALGPEFGGSIGVLFFLANVFSCALYISGFVEGIVDNFGAGGAMDVANPLPTDPPRWWSYFYATCVLAFCLIICLIGGAMFARTSVAILVVVIVCTVMVIVSVFAVNGKCVDIPRSNKAVWGNETANLNVTHCYNYTGLSAKTFEDNAFEQYTGDYSAPHPEKPLNFALVFAVLFSSVTGIMNGANMSGELKNPSKSIPAGTLGATFFTFCTYIVLCFLTAASADRQLLVNNYTYLQDVNLWPPFVLIGLFAATLSAALGNLIGSSRVLEALAKDDLFWFLLKPAKITTKNGNPWVAVLISWFLVQLVLLIGSLNAIAPMTSVLFLLSYASTNLSCLALELASAPNFRPTFKFFTWHTCTLGIIGSMVMSFLIEPIYAAVAIIVCMVLVIVMHLRTLPTEWGSISQALIFHQVRKYLLMLDSRKEHVKYWRPQILFMVSNPRSCCQLIEFVNDIKKGGLYILGHVKTGDNDQCREEFVASEYATWLGLVDSLKIKAFVELTVSPNVREGMHHLIRLSGLGGMKPNTICFGFYDNCQQEESIQATLSIKKKNRRFYSGEAGDGNMDFVQHFEGLRRADEDKHVSSIEYVRMINDALKMSKNVFICRYFHQLNKEIILKSKTDTYIDVWPVNFFHPESANYFDNTCLFLLQLACILNMVPGWKSHTILRVFLCVDSEHDDTPRKERKLEEMLIQLRIIAKIKTIPFEHVTSRLEQQMDQSPSSRPANDMCPTLPSEYLEDVNNLIQKQCDKTSVVFCYLPPAPVEPQQCSRYLNYLDAITNDLPPTVLVHGLHPVTSTTL